MKKNLPTYEFIISDDDESGVKAISIVSDPAFQSKLIAFAAVKSTFVALPETKGKKRKVCGLALIPNTPVYRVDDITGEEYMGFFSAETIEKIVEKFHAENNNNNLNLNHDDNRFVDAILVEDFIVDSDARVQDLKEKGITHENIKGSWCTTYKIMSPEVFDSVLNGGSKVGFSVEAYLDKIMVKMSEQINKSKLKLEMKKNNKSLLEKIMKIFSSEDFERALVPEQAITIEWGAPGEVVNQIVTDDKGNETLTPVGAGEFVTDAGTIVVDEASKLVEVRPPAPSEVAPVNQATDVVAPDVVPQPDSEKVDTVTGKTEDEAKMEKYPWDKCISDQLGKGYSQKAAEKICGYIKAKNMSSEELTDEMLMEALGEDECLSCKKKKKMEDEDHISLGDGIDMAKTDPMPMDPAAMMPVDPETETPETSIVDVNAKTIGDIVGTNDGDYTIKVKVEGGVVTEAEVSSETNLLKEKVTQLENQNKELQEKLKEPILDPILEPENTKEWAKMSTYEKVLARTRANQ